MSFSASLVWRHSATVSPALHTRLGALFPSVWGKDNKCVIEAEHRT
jgi:hypothetical protein